MLIACWILDMNYEIHIPQRMEPNEADYESKEELEEGVYPYESLINTGAPMTIHHKYYLCKNICSSPYLSQPIREEVMRRVFGNDNSDSTIHFRYICEIRFPLAELKDLLWQSITEFKYNKDEF